ncbi:GNAT family N-acetyltransferase [Streptomyces sp. NPDC047315]|uniref:GNAT family N-acetyltransferase n=1 Tax=Streptomyces sp. NPDC047315 TaxID=3155142 RepID=UPI0033DE8BC4
MPESHAATTHHVRPARTDDDAALAALDGDTWSALHSVTPRKAPPYGPFFHEHNPPENILVAQDGEPSDEHGEGGDVLGYIKLVSPTPLPSNRHVRQIQGLAVAHAARGRGVGRALLRAVCDEARRQGATRITLRVLGHNAPARALYEAEGFVVEGVLPGEFLLEGEYVDDVCMGRALY